MRPSRHPFGDARARKVSPGSTPRLGLILVLWALCFAPSARAQVSGSLALTSDYRLRGFSLTDGRAALSASAAYDHPSGFYVGGAVAAHDPARQGVQMLGHMEYLGFAGRRKDGGLSWDVGVNNVDMEAYSGRKYSLGYQQVYVGLSQDKVSAYVYFAPNYPRHGVDAAYIDLNGVLRPAENWRLSGHAGAQVRLGGSEREDGRRTRYDVTVAVAREFERCEINLAWVAVFPRPTPQASASRAGVVVGATFFF